jgi:hypothetical protein
VSEHLERDGIVDSLLIETGQSDLEDEILFQFVVVYGHPAFVLRLFSIKNKTKSA